MTEIKKPKTDEKLESETKKWLSRLEERLKQTTIASNTPLEDEVLENSMINVYSYVKDSKHFLNKKDYLNAFEACVYAWAIFETLERMGLLAKK